MVAKAPQLRDTKHLKAWIITIARNHVYDLFKKKQKKSSSLGASSRSRYEGSFTPCGSRITLTDNQAIAYGTNQTDAQVPTLFTLPSSGVWKFIVFVDREKYGEIVVKVE